MTKANDKQIAGTHYKSLAVQPWDFIDGNNIPFLEGSAIKYLSRWRDKGGVQDLHKAIHFIEKRIELENAKTAAGMATAAPLKPMKFSTADKKRIRKVVVSAAKGIRRIKVGKISKITFGSQSGKLK